MTDTPYRTEWQRLNQQLAELDRAYYQQDAPLVSDAHYDALRRRLLGVGGAYIQNRRRWRLRRRGQARAGGGCSSGSLWQAAPPPTDAKPGQR
jgi:NAD-dependent DNA ligase